MTFFYFMIVVFTELVLGASAQCPPLSLLARTPQTSQKICVERWKAKSLLVVAEVQCEPCQKLLYRMKKEASSQKREITVVWLESDDKACLEAALKVSGFAQSVCSSQRAVRDIWQIQSTPRIYWIQGNEPREQVGLIEDQLPLPW